MAAVLSAWQARHPVLAIVLVSLLAVVINCHPVIFAGRSFVSPASTGVLLYSWPPLFPGLPPDAELSAHGSDTPAMMMEGVAAGFIEARTLPHGELPLWNRYGHAGSTFIGQAISMLGDPLQLVVIFGRGAAWAWDLKYLIAKFLFCAGFGLLVLRRLGSPGLSLVFAAAAAYCGAFFYINNHQVFFVFCYAPWVLLSALELLGRKARPAIGWGLVWLWANVGCFCGGHVEPAVLVIGALNLAAVAWALAGCRGAAEWGAVLGRMTVAAGLFLGLTAPVWMSFFGALDGAFTAHAEVRIHQLPARFLPGAFDDLLYLLLRPNDAFPAVAPGTSLLVLCGCVLSVLHWRQLKTERFFWVNTAAVVLWAGCIFGWVPASLLVRIPFLNRDGHTDVDFSYVLVIHLTLQAAYGFKALAQERNSRRLALDFIWVALVFAGMLAAYDFGIQHQAMPWHYFLCAGAGALGAPALFAWWHSRGLRISAAGWTVILLLGLAAQFRFGIYAFGERSLLLLVGPRLALDASSPAIDRIKTDRTGPFRVVGMQYNLYGDYAAVYGLEDIRSCAPLTSAAYLDLLQNFPGMKLAFVWILEVKDPVAAQPLLNLLNVKYLLGPTNLAPPPGADWRVTDRSDFTVIENPEVWPRAYFTDQVEPIATTGEFIRRLAADGRQPLAALTPEEIATEPGLGPLTTTTNAVVVAATNYQLRANSTAFDVHAPSAGIVCLSEGQARVFTAMANGAPKAVRTVKRATWEEYLDWTRENYVEFTYGPAHWRAAATLFWLAAAGTAALAIAGLVCARRERRHARARRE